MHLSFKEHSLRKAFRLPYTSSPLLVGIWDYSGPIPWSLSTVSKKQTIQCCLVVSMWNVSQKLKLDRTFGPQLLVLVWKAVELSGPEPGWRKWVTGVRPEVLQTGPISPMLPNCRWGNETSYFMLLHHTLLTRLTSTLQLGAKLDSSFILKLLIRYSAPAKSG